MIIGHRLRLAPHVPALLASLVVIATISAAAPDRLTSRPRPQAPEVRPVAVGEEIRTSTGQRRRVVLPDRSIVYVNEQTSFKVIARRALKLTAGEVLVEAVPGKERFVVATPRRDVKALGTSFSVRAADGGTSVLVARGKVEVVNPAGGKTLTVSAGQRLNPDAAQAEAAPRASHVLGWARDLMIAAESPLVPASAHQGGSLTVVDPNGQQAKLSLRKYHLDVHVEDGFARTTIDQTYFNQSSSRLEGTFHFPLPADASLSRLAMYVDGTRMEGGMVERTEGRNIYETIVTRQQDPALLEWVDGTTFKMRVFPLEARQEKRIVLSYTQRLQSLYAQDTYRFPTGHDLDSVRDWSVHVRLKNGKDVSWASPSHTLRQRQDGSDRILEASARDVKLDRDFVLNLSPGKADETARFSTFEQDGAKYLMVRYRPELNPRGEPGRAPRDLVILFESSGDRDPLLARAQVEIVRGLLQNAEPDDTFAVLTAGTRTRSPMKERQPVTPENVEQAISFLENAHLIGALDLDRALTDAGALLKDGRTPHLVHVGSGIAAMGEQRQDALVKRIPEGVRYVGIGVGRRWNRALMKSAAEKSGGYFTQVNPDEPLSWRAFELASILGAPRLLDVIVRDGSKNRWLTFSGLVTHGEEVCAVTRLEKEMPEVVRICGMFDGQSIEVETGVRDVGKEAGYLPRTWAKLEIERLLAEDAGKHKDTIVGLSKSMYVMSPFTSLLVLENEAMYQQYKVDRGRKDHWAMYDCPEKIAVVFEPEDGVVGDPKKGVKPSARQVFDTIQVRARSARVLSMSDGQADGEQAMKSARLRAIAPTDFQSSSDVRTAILPPLPPGSEVVDGLQAYFKNRGYQFASAGCAGASGGMYGMSPGGRINYAPVFGSPAMQWIGTRMDTETTGSRSDSPMRVGQTIVLGNTTTKQNVIHAVTVRLFPRQPINYPATREGEKALAGLNLFDSRKLGLGFADPDKDGDGRFDDILLRARRASTGSLAFGDDGVVFPMESPSHEQSGSPSWVYRRPAFSGQDRLFFDLVSYASGMNTSFADMLAVIETEAVPSPGNKPGRIDDEARKLIDKVRTVGWRTLTIPGEGEEPAFKIVFDGTGRYAYERTLFPGIRERVVCDGETLWHLYPDLHIGVKRPVSRFHRQEFARLVPWALPRAEDLARGADVVMGEDRTVAIVPHGVEGLKDAKGKPLAHVRLHLVFDEEGRLTEQQVVEMPAKKLLGRIVFKGDGGIRVLDEKDKELQALKTTLAESKAPDLKPDVKSLVVLPLPYRTRHHIVETRKLKDRRNEDISFDDALALFAADFAASNGQNLLTMFRESFHGRDQRQLGLYVLLAAAGLNLDAQNADVLAEHRDDPLAQYLALHTSPVLRQHASQWAVASTQWGDGALRHLAVTHALLQRWQNGRVLNGNRKQREDALAEALAYAEKHRNSQFGFALLGLMTDRAAEAERGNKDAKDVHAALARAWGLYRKTPGLETAAQYEHARALWKTGQREDGRKAFLDLYQTARKQDGLLLIDEDFHRALLGKDTEKDEWNPLIRATARQLVEKKQRGAVLALARQCWQLDDQPLAQDLLTLALDGIPERKERLALTAAGVQFLRENGKLVEAERLLQPLLEDGEWTKRADLWRLAASLAEGRELPARTLECLERALDAEFRDRPEVMKLETIDNEYGRLLRHYQGLAEAMVTLKVTPPTDFLPKVVRTADRWRSLSRNGTGACDTAARILRQLGESELAWDYLTTPVGLQPGSSAPWVGLATMLRRQGDLKLADAAFASAFAAEPTSAQILWDRAQNLRQTGNVVEAKKLLRQLAEGTWQSRFQSLQAQARWQLDLR